jgi:hypothetical protein
MVIVPVTAMPYAYDSAAELRNANTTVSTATINMPLIQGM